MQVKGDAVENLQAVLFFGRWKALVQGFLIGKPLSVGLRTATQCYLETENRAFEVAEKRKEK